MRREWSSAGTYGRSPRKPGDQCHPPARSSFANNPGVTRPEGLSPVRLAGRVVEGEYGERQMKAARAGKACVAARRRCSGATRLRGKPAELRRRRLRGSHHTHPASPSSIITTGCSREIAPILNSATNGDSLERHGGMDLNLLLRSGGQRKFSAGRNKSTTKSATHSAGDPERNNLHRLNGVCTSSSEAPSVRTEKGGGGKYVAISAIAKESRAGNIPANFPRLACGRTSRVKIHLPPTLKPHPAILSGDRGADGCRRFVRCPSISPRMEMCSRKTSRTVCGPSFRARVALVLCRGCIMRRVVRIGKAPPHIPSQKTAVALAHTARPQGKPGTVVRGELLQECRVIRPWSGTVRLARLPGVAENPRVGYENFVSPVHYHSGMPEPKDGHFSSKVGPQTCARVLDDKKPGEEEQRKGRFAKTWAALNIDVLRTDEGGASVSARSSAGMQGRGKQEIPEKTRRPAASSGTIHTCE
ncbi:hypothetical protein PR048_028631 [Dryococelus australis]|uniref:Uncharacterized protein n=1 Tax=Dryococelus australis TaxID=614101 RepID=A0ABQ9GDX2_9NEOP|nr:hypothetical protein PR048_028631 [Dryococelus australis]